MQRSAATISDGLKKVPPFPPVAVKLLSLLSDPAVDANEVADLIGSDATFTARLLQRVNSAEFGFVSDVTNVRRAVTLLGLDTTRQITLAHATAAYAQGGLKTETMRRCWQHTVATAVLAEEIAEACEIYTSVAITAGIMHDVGRLGLLVAYPEEYERLVRHAAERCLDVLDFEEEEFGAHHAEAGRLLAEGWGLPSEMALIAGRHHDPCEGVELDLLRIVHVSCRLADALGYDIVKPLNPSTASDVMAQLPPPARARLVRDPEELHARIEERIREFGSETSGPPPEVTLALLSSANAEQQLEPAAEVVQSDADPGPEEPPAGQVRPSRMQAVIGWVVVVLVIAVAAALWAFR
jgi:putative nucleotidyltransferase with HDIG domain